MIFLFVIYSNSLRSCLILTSHVQPTTSQGAAPEPPEPPPHLAQAPLQRVEQVPDQASQQVQVQVPGETPALLGDMSRVHGVPRGYARIQQPELSHALPSPNISSLRTSSSSFPLPPKYTPPRPPCPGQDQGDGGAEGLRLAPLLPGVWPPGSSPGRTPCKGAQPA